MTARDLTDHEMRILACLALAEGVLDACPDNFARIMGVTPDEALAAVKSLEADGFITRDRDADEPTPSGELPS